MAFVFKDGASSTIVTAINNTATSIILESVASFPQGMVTGDYTIVTISNSDNTLREVVKVTAINYITKTLTAQRGYDSTIALNWPANSKVEIRAGSSLLNELAVTSSAMVLLTSKKIITPPSGSGFFIIDDTMDLFSESNKFRKFKIKVQDLNNNTSGFSIGIALTAKSGLNSATVPHFVDLNNIKTYPNSVNTAPLYARSYAGSQLPSQLGKVTYKQRNSTTSTTVIYEPNQLNSAQLVPPIFANTQSASGINSEIDVSLSFRYDGSELWAKVHYKFVTASEFNSNYYIYEAFCEEYISNKRFNGTGLPANSGGTVLDTSLKFTGFCFYTQGAMHGGGSQYADSAYVSLYGIR